ncbi:uncharacterized protein LOC117234310 [Bombus vosnesenskii]|uniref:Uncharacterized protein LOC117234310 n=1 Tax=Bombus vosnesenskii TaxID=207650 RepID=A0A6J3KH84_9HYME|nr:uncharacterized protein LOC117166235 [Bombus vancouverensis nearcticus]XP_033351284.1 uncharacterized protein LOC117234310 [Bombus vosnesenskii]
MGNFKSGEHNFKSTNIQELLNGHINIDNFSARELTSAVVNNPFEMTCSIVLPALRQLVCAQKTNIEWYVVTWTRNYDQTGFYERLDIAALRVLSVWNKNDG